MMTQEEIDHHGFTKCPRRKYVLGDGYSLIVYPNCPDPEEPHRQWAKIVFDKQQVGEITFILLPDEDQYDFWELEAISSDTTHFGSFLKEMKLEYIPQESGMLYLMTGTIQPQHRGKKLMIKAIRSLIWYARFYGHVGFMAWKPYPISDDHRERPKVEIEKGVERLSHYYAFHFPFLKRFGDYLLSVHDGIDWCPLTVYPRLQRRYEKWRQGQDDYERQIEEMRRDGSFGREAQKLAGL